MFYSERAQRAQSVFSPNSTPEFSTEHAVQACPLYIVSEHVGGVNSQSFSKESSISCTEVEHFGLDCAV